MSDQATNIVRVQRRENPFVVIDKTALVDKELSWKAKGIHAYILSLPDDWKIYERDLVKRSKDGRDSMRAGLKELIDKGYMERKAIRDDKGRIERWETVVFEVPQPKSEGVSPESDFPKLANPTLENPTYTKEELELNKNLSSVVGDAVSNDSNIYKHYEKTWGIAPNASLLSMQRYQQMGFEDALIIECMEIAVKKGKRWTYAAGILDNLEHQHNVFTLEGYKALSHPPRTRSTEGGTNTKNSKADFFNELAASLKEDEDE